MKKTGREDEEDEDARRTRGYASLPWLIWFCFIGFIYWTDLGARLPRSQNLRVTHLATSDSCAGPEHPSQFRVIREYPDDLPFVQDDLVAAQQIVDDPGECWVRNLPG